TQDENNKLFDSRIRSGFIGTQFGFGVSNKFSESVEAKAFLAVWMNGVDSSKGTAGGKDVDFREAWGSLVSPGGTFLFGRAFSIFGSASGEVNRYAFEYAVGHPCLADGSTIGCGSTGAGPLYAGFNAQLRYISPRFFGFEAQASLEDPSSLPDYHITRYPRIEGEMSYELNFLGDGKFVVKGQGLAQQLGKLDTAADGTKSVKSTTAWGVMGAARFEAWGLKLGGGGWTGKGMGTHTPLQQDDQAKPLAHDLPGGGFPGDELRSFRGFFGNAVYDYHGTALAAGAGIVFVQETDADAEGKNTSLLRQNAEFHVVFTQRIHSVILSAEYMHWISDWYLGENQVLNFTGGGATFVW
ncbi:MAG TPA: hypothetical protein VGY54_21560, partial [Polyangiaceae bacterium]|nr:hypothetical protein [Polyangiaceae bacterium]